MTELQKRFRGALLGLAAGDALGTTLEFTGPGPHGLSDMVGGGPFGLLPGQWTDDTSMALCLAESLVLSQGMDLRDQMERYLAWHDHGHLSSTGRCFDIGGTTLTALEHFRRTGEPLAGSTDPMSAGNGSIMRLAPVPMFYQRDAAQAIAMSALSSRTTHGAREAVDACRYLGGLLWGALNGVDKGTLLGPRWSPLGDGWSTQPLATTIAEVAEGSFWRREPPQIAGTGYVVRSLEAALWALARSEDFASGALLAANLGQDADTTAAVYGQLAGALYGQDAIPAHWQSRLALHDTVLELADGLYRLAGGGAAEDPDAHSSEAEVH
ncbi:MAG: ADP-ribosylglycohydrolase family protein [Anaerolineae bacterium]|jgi:ADP-ribosyl-[dinitrogen reductase] hydrolase|nr:ADP-ribosylglycohydrolase family protein [Chloroflexota bacterium]